MKEEQIDKSPDDSHLKNQRTGFVVKAECKRKTTDPKTWTPFLVGKPFTDMDRLGGKIRKLAKEVRKIGMGEKSNTQAAQIQYVNSVIMGIEQYIQPSIYSMVELYVRP